MVQQVKILVAKPDDLSSIPRTHLVEGREARCPLNFTPRPWYVHALTHVHTRTHLHSLNKYSFKNAKHLQYVEHPGNGQLQG